MINKSKTIYTKAVTELQNLVIDSTWDKNGTPLFTITNNQRLPKNLLMQHAIIPEGVTVTEEDIRSYFYYFETATPETPPHPLVSSGVFYSQQISDGSASVGVNVQFPRPNNVVSTNPLTENTKFDYWYGLKYLGDAAKTFGPTIINYTTQTPTSRFITSMANQPYLANFTTGDGLLNASIDPVDKDNTNLIFNINHNKPLLNLSRGSSSYKFVIERLNGSIGGAKIYYNLNGTVVDESNKVITITNVTNGKFAITLPFTHVVTSPTTEQQHITNKYNISMYYTNQDNIETKSINFNTTNISKFNDDFVNGNIAKYHGFDQLNATKEPLYLVDEDISKKHRLSLSVSDIALTSNKYPTTGSYSSPVYNLDMPLYSIFIVSKEILPHNIDHSSIKYYVNFSKNEEYEIWPMNKNNNKILYNDEQFDSSKGKFSEPDKQQRIPKLYILDNIKISSPIAEVKAITFERPIYSFNIRIVFDLISSDGVDLDDYFIPPFIDYFECHVSDKESFLRI